MKKKYKILPVVLASLLITSTMGILTVSAIDRSLSTGVVEENVEPSIEFTKKYASTDTTMGVIVSNLDDYSLVWYVDDIQVSTEDTYTITENDIENFLKVEIISNGEIVLTKSIYCSELPVIYIDCNDIDTQNIWNSQISKGSYSTATMKVQGNSTYVEDSNLYDGDIQIKGQGSSTWNWDKKPYELNLNDATSLFGMGESRHWILLANYIDGTLIRNYSAYSLAKELNQVAMDSVFVDMVVNDTYMGNYQLCEKIDINDNRIDICDYESIAQDVVDSICKHSGITDNVTIKSMQDALITDLSWISTNTFTFDGNTYTISEIYEDWNTIQEKFNNVDGYILELSTEVNTEVSQFSTLKDNNINCIYPKCIDTNETMFNDVKSKINNFESAIYNNTGNVAINDMLVPYNDLCNMDSLLSYWTICMIYMNEIGHSNNYMYLKDGELNFAPVWNFDWSSGCDAPEVSSWPSLNYDSWINSNGVWWGTWFTQIGNNPYFAIKVQEYYLNNRDIINSFLNSDNPDSFINRTYNEIYSSANANDEVWSNVSYEESYNTFTTWIDNRLSWIDEQFATESSAISSLYIGYGSSISDNLSIEVKYVDGSNLKYDDISKVTSGGKVEDGKDIQISINDSLNNNTWNTCYLDIYVNNHLIDTIKYNNETTNYTIDSDKLDSDLNTKNIIQVCTKNSADGTSYTSNNFITVVKYDDSDDSLQEYREVDELPTIKSSVKIITQPNDYIATVGDTVIFKIDTVGNVLKYQWQSSVNGVDWFDSTLNGSITDTLPVEVMDETYGRYFRCVVTDTMGNKIISNSVTISTN